MINYNNISSNKIADNKTYYRLNWGALNDIENIHYYFYNNATIYLDRKKKDMITY